MCRGVEVTLRVSALLSDLLAFPSSSHLSNPLKSYVIPFTHQRETEQQLYWSSRKMSLTQRTQYNPPQTYTVPLSPATLTHFRSPQEAKSDPAFLPPAKLKIKIAPHVNITSPPFPQGVYGRKVEQVADIVVGMGGRVVVNVVVDAEVLAGCEVEEGRDVDGMVKACIAHIMEVVSSVSWLAHDL